MRVVLDACVVDTRRSRVHRRGQAVGLGGKEAAVVEVLARAAGPVTREELGRQVWAGAAVSVRSVDRLVQRVRAKLGASVDLRTIVGVGYELVRGGQGATGVPALFGETIGRAAPLDRLHRWLESGTSALALVGPGGIGKTRLALEASAAAPAYLRDGVVFAPLDAVPSVAGVPNAIRAAVGARSGTRLEALFWGQQVLLVLDNLEHLDCTALLARLAAIPGPRLLLTSQVVPALPGLEVLDLPGLDGPDGVALFEERAHCVGYHGEARDHAAAMVDLVEGSPLAIELVAAQCRTRPIAEVRSQVEASLGSVGVAFPDLPARHRSLRAAYAHSSGLLPAASRAALGRICVFRAPFTPEAAAVVTEVDSSVLGELVAASLLRDVEGRFALHPSIRACAGEAGLHQAYAARHSRWMLERLAQLPTLSRGRGERTQALTDELPDVAAAWRSADPTLALRPALDGLGDLLLSTHRIDEARALLGPLTEHPVLGTPVSLRLALVEYHVQERTRPIPDLSADAPLQDRVLWMWLRGMRHRARREPEASLEALEAAADLARQAGHPGIQVQVLCNLGSQHARLRRLEPSRVAFDEALRLAESLGDDTLVAQVLGHRAWLHIWAFRFEHAHQDLVQADALLARLGDLVQLVTVRFTRATLARIEGDDHEEIALHEGLLQAMERARIRSHQRAASEGRLAVLHGQRGEHDASEAWLARLRETAALLGDPIAARKLALAELELHWLHGRPAECLAICERYTVPGPRPFLVPELRVRCLHALGRDDEARAALADALAEVEHTDPAFRGPAVRAIAFSVTGDADDGLRALTSCVGRGRGLLREVVELCGGDATGDDVGLEAERQRLVARLSG